MTVEVFNNSLIFFDVIDDVNCSTEPIIVNNEHLNFGDTTSSNFNLSETTFKKSFIYLLYYTQKDPIIVRNYHNLHGLNDIYCYAPFIMLEPSSLLILQGKLIVHLLIKEDSVFDNFFGYVISITKDDFNKLILLGLENYIPIPFEIGNGLYKIYVII